MKKNSLARNPVSQVRGYYHIGSYPFMLATTGDSQIFGMNPICKTEEPVKMIQKLPREININQKNNYDPQHCFEPEGPTVS